MNDDPRPHELDEREALAASAVVDGTDSVEERALVAGSPQLEAWIESYHHIIAELDDVPIPTAARESALAAALAVFDELHAGEAPTVPIAEVAAVPTVAVAAAPAGNVVTLADRPRRRWRPQAILGAAAAVVAVLAIGAVIAGTNSNDDAINSAATVVAPAEASGEDAASRKTDVTEHADAPAAASEQAPVEMAAPSETMSPASTIGSIDGAADAGTAAPSMATAPADAAGVTEAPADTTADTTAGTTSDTPSTFATTITERVLDQQALLAYAARVTGSGGSPSATTTTPVAPAPTDACATADVEVLGDVLYGPEGIPARVVRDLASGAIRAEALDTCQVLASVMP